MKFSDACLNTADYLASEEFKTREDAHGTNKGKFVPLLIEINELEYLTFDSQEGFVGIPTQGKYKGKKTMSERAYVCGFMEEERARDFCMNLNGTTDKVALIVCSSLNESEIPVTISHIPPNKTKGFIDEIPKSERKAYKKELERRDKNRKHEWDVQRFTRETRLTTTMEEKYIEFEWENATKLKKKHMKGHSMIICFDPTWNRRSDKKGGLLPDIIKSLEQI